MMNCKWFLGSNRYKHFLLGIPCGLIFSILFGLGIASGMEFKDCQAINKNKPISQWNWKSWDWLDWICTVIGSAIGNCISILLFLIIF